MFANSRTARVTGYRCDACGNKTRFDVVETKRVRSFQHFSLGGEMTVEEEEVLAHEVEKVTCRWCGSSDSIAPLIADTDGSEGEVGR